MDMREPSHIGGLLRNKLFLLSALFFFSLPTLAQEEDPLDVQLGEKLFLEDRFSQSFFQKYQSKTNQVVTQGEKALEFLETPFGLMEHPHRGKQVSCASCHFVDQATTLKDSFVFTYNDFTSRTPVPLRSDKTKRTLRNSMNMVLSSLKEGRPLHWDGEFYSATDLSCASLVGRNMGWQLKESSQAKSHIASILRGDDGTYPTDSDLKQPYAKSFALLGHDIARMSDKDLFQVTCKVMAAYLENIDFSRDDNGEFNASAYDRFLKENHMRRSPKKGESDRQYLQYLRDHLNYKKDWKWLKESELNYHEHSARFNKKELRGMQLFFGKAQCASCHTPPDFTNFGFHNTGISQLEYDGIHGKDAFSQIKIPSLKKRKKFQEKYLFATEENSKRQGVFRQVPQKEEPLFVDLGLWNVFGHPDRGSVQEKIKASICSSDKMPACSWNDEEYLKRSVGRFKTPTLRSLGQSAPYFHNGNSQSLEKTLQVYRQVSAMARAKKLVNGDPMLRAMRIDKEDIEFLKAFMESLDEDYD